MKRALIAAGMLMIFAAPARADFKEDVASIMESVREIAKQRDEAIRDREYWASRACPDYSSAGAPDHTIAFKIFKDASPKATYTLADIDNPDTSVCLLRIAGECVLGYDGKTHAIVATRTISAAVKSGQ